MTSPTDIEIVKIVPVHFTRPCGCVIDITDSPVSMCPVMEKLHKAFEQAKRNETGDRHALGAACNGHLIGRWREVLVGFDLAPTEDGTYPPSFKAWWDGDTWNGWVCPFFEKAEADKVAAYFAQDPATGYGVKEEDLGPEPVMSYDPELDAYLERDPNYFAETQETPLEYAGRTMPVGVTQVYEAEQKNGRTVYGIGAYGMTWDQQDSDPDYGTIRYAAKIWRQWADGDHQIRAVDRARYQIIAERLEALVAAGRGDERPTEAVIEVPPSQPWTLPGEIAKDDGSTGPAREA